MTPRLVLVLALAARSASASPDPSPKRATPVADVDPKPASPDAPVPTNPGGPQPANDRDPDAASPAPTTRPLASNPAAVVPLPPLPPATSTPSGATPSPDPTAIRAKADEDPAPRFSLPTEGDRLAWQRSGFRLGLAAGYGELVGLRGAPSGRSLAAKLRVGLRLDRQWSLLASFEYARASSPGGLSGLRFAGTLDPTWHVTPNLSLALGFGFGGIVEGRTGRMDADPLASTLESSYTFPDARTPIASCSGVGAAGLARVEYGYVLGPRAQATLAGEALGQWTGCVDDTHRFEPDTGKAIARRQWWPHTGFMLALGVTWR